MNEAFLLIGGNMGDRLSWMEKAETVINAVCGKIVDRSSIYETAAWGKADQPHFLNRALRITTTLSPSTLMEKILETENRLGRLRKEKFGPRTIDIDIIFYNDQIINIPGLVIPHPHVQDRKFALVCLADIAPEKKHPVLGHTVRQMLEATTDPLMVNKFC